MPGPDACQPQGGTPSSKLVWSSRVRRVETGTARDRVASSVAAYTTPTTSPDSSYIGLPDEPGSARASVTMICPALALSGSASYPRTLPVLDVNRPPPG